MVLRRLSLHSDCDQDRGYAEMEGTWPGIAWHQLFGSVWCAGKRRRVFLQK